MDNNYIGKKVLLIAPKFGNFYIDIIKYLENLGAKKVSFIENKTHFLDITAIRAKGQCLREFYSKLFSPDRRYMNKIYATGVLDQIFDICICIQDHSLNPTFFERIRNRNPKIKIILYLWDTMNLFNGLRYKKYFDNVFSFDYRDCQEYGLQYLPNFFVIKDHVRERGPILFDLCFAGRQHTDRFQVLLPLYLKLKNKVNLSFALLVIDKQRFHYSVIYYFLKKIAPTSDFVLNYELLEKKKKADFLIYKSLRANILQEMVDKSRCVLDIQHPSQAGIPHQIMLALALGKKIITTNENIKYTPFFDSNIIHVINRKKPDIPIEFLKRDYCNIRVKELAMNFELSSWLKKLIN